MEGKSRTLMRLLSAKKGFVHVASRGGLLCGVGVRRALPPCANRGSGGGALVRVILTLARCGIANLAGARAAGLSCAVGQRWAVRVRGGHARAVGGAVGQRDGRPGKMRARKGALVRPLARGEAGAAARCAAPKVRGQTRFALRELALANHSCPHTSNDATTGSFCLRRAALQQ